VNEREYTFTKREGLLAHYSKASSVFEHILPSGELRLSAYRLMRDPAENKDIPPSICSLRPSPEDDQAIEQVYALIKSERDRMHLLSFSGDAEDRGEFPGFDCCWSRPRMWEQYGDVHRGASLLFDRTRLERAIREQWPDEGRYSDKVDYAREGSAEVFRRALSADEILAHERPAQAVRDYIKANRDAYFFLKSDDFATEHEYRVVLAGGDGDYICIEYSDSLVGVVLGERFPVWQEPGAIKACSNAGVKKLGRMCWDNGRPRVGRVWPATQGDRCLAQ
jgi:hypothetical protein